MHTGWRDLLPMLLVFAALPCPAPAEVTLDGTLGPAGALAGPDYWIPAEVGRQVGGNLFHSFGRFGLAGGESATFSGPASVANVIGRVTGGRPSGIDGTLRSTIPNADLYLVNPAGVMLGPNARLEVDGAFHATTAHHLQLQDGGRFDAAEPGRSTLTAAPVAAFGFLDRTPAPVTLEGGFLRVPEGERLSLVGGDVRIVNGTLYAPGGRIAVAAAGPGEALSFTESGIGTERGPGSGSVEIVQTVARPLVDGLEVPNLVTTSQGGGSLQVTGGRIALEGASLQIGTMGAGDAGKIAISAQSDARLDEAATVTAVTAGTGRGGDIEIDTGGALTVSGGAFVGAFTLGPGDAGVVQTHSDRLLVEDGSSITSSSAGAGDAGAIRITAADLDVRTGGLITSSTRDEGDGGSVDIRIRGDVALEDGGNISSFTNASGNAGEITLSVGGLLAVNGGSFVMASSNVSGDAGNVAIDAGEVRIGNGSWISTFTAGPGRAGNIAIVSGQLAIDAGSNVTADTAGTGDGGSVAIDSTGPVFVTNASYIGAHSLHREGGNAGRVDIHAAELRVEGDSEVGVTTEGDGNGGDIELVVDRLVILGGAGVASNTSGGAGAGGDISVEARASVQISGQNEQGGVSAMTAISYLDASGDAGSIRVRTPLLEIGQDAGISVGTLGSGNGGVLELSTDRLILTDRGGINANTYGSGNGGAISITADESIHLQGAGEGGLWTYIASTSVGSGIGGTVTIRTPLLELAGQSRIESNAEAGGHGGRVRIEAGRLVLREGGRISALALGSGQGGDIVVDTSGGLVLLQGDPRPTDRQTEISTDSRRNATGDAGDIEIHTGELVLNGFAWVSSSTEGGGGGGDVRVAADRRIDIRGEPVWEWGGLWAATTGSGDGGNLVLIAPEVDVSGRGRIDVRSEGSGRAGDIRIEAGRLLWVDNATVSATSNLTSGGIIGVDAGSTQLTHGGRISASVFGDEHSDGGNVTITGDSLVALEDSRITATAAVGLGGRIVIDTEVFLHDAAALGDVLDASSGTAGNDGTVDVNAPELDISGSLVALPGSFLDASGELSRSCDAARAGRRSSLLVRGRDRVSPAPDVSGGAAVRGCRGRDSR